MSETRTNFTCLITILMKIASHYLVLMGISFGIAFGIISGVFGTYSDDRWDIHIYRLVGDLFLNALKMIILPLVFSSMVLAGASMSSSNGIQLGVQTFLFILISTSVAVFIGLAFVNAIKPGSFMNSPISSQSSPPQTNTTDKSIWSTVTDIFISMIPANVPLAFSENNILGVVSFGLIFGAALGRLPENITILDAQKSLLDHSVDKDDACSESNKDSLPNCFHTSSAVKSTEVDGKSPSPLRTYLEAGESIPDTKLKEQISSQTIESNFSFISEHSIVLENEEDLIANQPNNVLSITHKGKPVVSEGDSLPCAPLRTLSSPNPKALLLMIFQGIYDVSFIIVDAVLMMLPLGVCCLIARQVAHALGDGTLIAQLGNLAIFSVTVIAGLSSHFLLLLLVVKLVARVSPLRHVCSVAPCLLVAFSTASSAAALPVGLRCVERRMGVSKCVASFVLPFGCTLNMNGTALFECVVVIFLAQVYGIEMSIAEQALASVLALISALGVAAVPSASFVAILLILQAVNARLISNGKSIIPIESIAMIMIVNHPLDMLRTVVNVYSDTVNAAIIATRVEKESMVCAVKPQLMPAFIDKQKEFNYNEQQKLNHYPKIQQVQQNEDKIQNFISNGKTATITRNPTENGEKHCQQSDISVSSSSAVSVTGADEGIKSPPKKIFGGISLSNGRSSIIHKEVRHPTPVDFNEVGVENFRNNRELDGMNRNYQYFHVQKINLAGLSNDGLGVAENNQENNDNGMEANKL